MSIDSGRTVTVHLSSRFQLLFAGAVAIALSSGCSGGGSLAPAANAPLDAQSQSVRTVQSAALQHDPYLSMLPPGLRLANVARVGRTA
ncbi:MAG: hypothetical protein IAI50_05045, partial [Candidatus Eremiobacteraeota bacterium]|nr:hypothetical protein [Candidatus Eremiobacteraeota bacterium]